MYNLIKGSSYWESFIQNVMKANEKIDMTKYNSKILLYQYEYDSKITQTLNTIFIGSYEYTEGEDPDDMKELFKQMGWK